MKVFKCKICGSVIAEELEEGLLQAGSLLWENIRNTQGHKFGEHSECKECGHHFARDIYKVENWSER